MRRDGSCEDDAAPGLLFHHLTVDNQRDDDHVKTIITEQRITYLATACAQSQLPVVLMSSVRFHSLRHSSSACVHATTPAKHNNISTLPSSDVVCATASRTHCPSVTSTALMTTLAQGKLAMSSWIARSPLSGWTSQSETPDAPCSRSARATTNPRFPHPPVTAQKEWGCGAYDGGNRLQRSVHQCLSFHPLMKHGVT